MKTVRSYSDYDDYKKHQKKKTLDPVRREKWLGAEWQEKITMFTELFKRVQDVFNEGDRALCLCARTGQEVVALNDMGLDAIGVDLVEAPPLVIEGDIHDLPFEDNTFDFAFCNSFDHSLYPDKFLEEMQRVLKPGGHGLLHLQLMSNPDQYAENIITTADPVINRLTKCEMVKSRSLNGVPHATYHWELLFRKI